MEYNRPHPTGDNLPCQQFPSQPETAHLINLLVQHPNNVAPFMEYTNAVLRSDGELAVAFRGLIAAYVSGLNAFTLCFSSCEIYPSQLGHPKGQVTQRLNKIDSVEIDDNLSPDFAYFKKTQRPVRQDDCC